MVDRKGPFKESIWTQSALCGKGPLEVSPGQEAKQGSQGPPEGATRPEPELSREYGQRGREGSPQLSREEHW